jgi:hypothetical protein
MAAKIKLDEVRQRIRLTSTERRVAMFIVAAFVLGLVTKCYRDGHSSPAPVLSHTAKTASMSMSETVSTSEKTYETRTAKRGDTAKRTPLFSKKNKLPDSAAEQQYQQK